MTTAPNSTRVQDDYAQQIAGDLSANQAAQQQARTELQRLQHQLEQLEESQKVLLKMQEALGIPTQPTPTTNPDTNPDVTTSAKTGAKTRAKTSAQAGLKPGAQAAAKPSAKPAAPTGSKPAAKPDANPAAKAGAKAGVKRAAVPAARTAAHSTKKTTEPHKTTTPKNETAPTQVAAPAQVPAPAKAAEPAKVAEVKQAAAKTPRARKTTEKTETKKENGPSWLDLVTAAIAGQTEPKSAAEVTDTLTATHPERKVQATVIRNTLEQGVARGILERTKQGRSVYYTPTTTPHTNHPHPQLP